jgi:hypothetical protein
MDLDVCKNLFARSRDISDGGGIATESDERFAQTDAFDIAYFEDRWIEIAGQGPRRSECRRKAHTFLITKGNNLDGERQVFAALRQFLDGNEARDDTKSAIVSASVSYGIDM